MECWLVGICCWVSFRLHLNIGQELNTLMPVAFHANGANVHGRSVRCLHRRGRPALLDQPFASSAMGDSMMKCGSPPHYLRTLLAITADLEPASLEPDFISASRLDNTLITVREWVQAGSAPTWSDCAGLSPELRSWQLQFGNLSVDSDDCLWRPSTLQLVVPLSARRSFIQRYHDSIFHVSRTVYRLLDRVYWPGLRDDVQLYIASCSVCLARKSPCPRRAPMGHVSVRHLWDRVAMDILDMSVTTPKGNRYVLVMVDCLSRWTEACPLPNKTALAVTDAFFQLIVCRFGMPAVIHSDQGREFENNMMQELAFWVALIKFEQLHITQPVTGCWRDSIALGLLG